MKKTTSGFTIVEVLVVVAVIGILTTVGFVSYTSIQSNTRDSQKSSRITLLAEALEKYYDQNGEYPGCTAMSASPATIETSTLKGIDANILATPTAVSGTNSILPSCADLTSDTDNFAYVGDGSAGCLTGTACLQFTLKYDEESTGNIISVTSRRTVVSGGAIAAPAAPTTTVTSDGTNILATITPVTCTSGTAQYEINGRTNDGSWSGYTSWDTSTTATRLSSQATKYGYRAQARCYLNNFSYSTVKTGSEGTYISAITSTPSAPTVTATTTDTTSTTYSWNTPTCIAGTTARFQYDFSTSYGYDFGWVATAGNSVSFTTASSGYTYTVQAKTQCYNDYASSSWSSTGSAGYYRPYLVQVLAVAGGGGGGSSSSDASGGGGGGGGVVYFGSMNKTISSAGGYSVAVGTGGNGGSGGSNNASEGGNSTFLDITAYGGGRGGYTNEGGYNGGCGGGGAGAQSGSENSRGLSIQTSNGGGSGFGNYGGKGQWRNDGKSGGGGGGAGGIGGSGYDGATEGPGKMTGGAGYYSTLSGSGVYYAGGGGGASCCYWGSGGSGGGGNGAQNGTGAAGTNGLGGGGGGGGSSGGGHGGSGIVIIRYNTAAMSASGGVGSTVGSDTVQTFTSSGTLTVY